MTEFVNFIKRALGIASPEALDKMFDGALLTLRKVDQLAAEAEQGIDATIETLIAKRGKLRNLRERVGSVLVR